MKTAILLWFFAGVLLAQDDPVPQIPNDLQTSWRASVSEVDLARAELAVAQAELKLIKAQKAEAVESAKLYATCGDGFEAVVSGPTSPVLCSKKKELAKK